MPRASDPRMIGIKAGIALLNMGSPASPGETRAFLYRLFLDPEIFRFPGGALARPLFALLIAGLRAPRVRRRYQVLGGTSPLLSITRAQAAALEAALCARGLDAAVEVCMRYSRPFAEETVQKLVARGANTLVGLPLYPQYSRTTTGSSLRALREARERNAPGLDYLEIEHWYDLPSYHRALARRIAARSPRGNGNAASGLLFLAHSLPRRFVQEGDPYVEQIRATVRGVLEALEKEDWERVPWFMAYQGQVGPVKWVGPPVRDVLENMVAEGITRCTVAPLSFVSDHLETLYEIDLEVRRFALERGMERFERIAPLNAGNDFMEALADLTLERLRCRRLSPA